MKTTIKYVKRKDEKLFPHPSFPWRLEPRNGMNLAWFQRLDHVEDHIKRYSLKPKDYRAKLNEWRNGCETIYPPKGTQIADRLKDELYKYCINGPQAKQRSQIKNGRK